MDNNMNSNAKSVFNSINQFDSRYKQLGNFGKQRSACSLFSLLTVHSFMNNRNTTYEQHLENLDQAVGNFVDIKLGGSITFDRLLEFQATYKSNDIIGTSVQLIAENILGYGSMFKDESDNFTSYAVIFLKNYNFFTVLVLKENNNVTYFVRNCHEKIQCEFSSMLDLTNYLNETYQFNKELNLDGYTDADFSNIEFLIIDKPFAIKLNKTQQKFPPLQVEQTPQEDQTPQVEYNESGEFQIEGFDEDSDDEDNAMDNNIPNDGDISDEDDFMTEAQTEMTQHDVDMQMAMALQQEFGEDNVTENVGGTVAGNNIGGVGIGEFGTDMSMEELVKQQTEAMKAFQNQS